MVFFVEYQAKLHSMEKGNLRLIRSSGCARPPSSPRLVASMAGVSAADVRSVLSLPTPGPSAGPSQTELFLAATQPKERKRKPEGISRELYSLIGDSTPSLQAQFTKPRLKQKPTFGNGGTIKW
jgi:hypothetical protein